MPMISSEHEIWKFADAGDELDDWLPYAEDLIEKWSGQDKSEVYFNGTFEIVLASLLLMDGLLPASARHAFARLTLDVIDEAEDKRCFLSSLGMRPPRPGRQEDLRAKGYRIHKVRELIKAGHKSTDAYDLVAKEVHKSPDTVRRDYERAMKKVKRNKKGEIDK